MSDTYSDTYRICFDLSKPLVEVFGVCSVSDDGQDRTTLRCIGGAEFVFNKRDAVYIWITEE